MAVYKPVNLTERCPPDSTFETCSAFGYVFLGIMVQLFGDAADKRIQRQIEQERREEYETNRYYRMYEENNKKYIEYEEYDFIVVGAGAAGCVVASRLTECEDNQVLLLEAGPEQPDVTLGPSFAVGLFGSNIMWMYRTHPNGRSCLAYQDQRCVWPTGKVMGGGSSVNSLAYVRGNKLDYDTWAAMGNDGWSYEEVLPYFKKSERNLNIDRLNPKYHGVDGPLSISNYPYVDLPSIMLTLGYNQSGLPIRDFNGEEQVGTMQAQAFAKNGERVSTNNAFIQPIRYKRKNLNVKVESFVVELLMDRNRACGVRYIKDGKSYKAFARKEVILSAGPIRSPMILMLSGIGPKDHLEELGIPVVKDLPVGHNLHDHVTFDGILIILPNETATTVSNEQLIEALFEYKNMTVKHGPLSANGPVNSVGFMKTDDSLPAPDIQFQADNVEDWKEYVKNPALYKGLYTLPTPFYNGVLPRTMVVTPKSRGCLTLNSSDIYGYPILDVNYFGHEDDMVTLIKGVKFLLTLENSRAFKERGAYFYKEPLAPCEKYTWGTDEYIACMAMSYTSSAYHPVGTCKMGPSYDKTAVVDPRLKVHGIKGLRVIDSSIMPVAPRGNTNAPSIMVGERGVAFVLEDWCCKT